MQNSVITGHSLAKSSRIPPLLCLAFLTSKAICHHPLFNSFSGEDLWLLGEDFAWSSYEKFLDLRERKIELIALSDKHSVNF